MTGTEIGTVYYSSTISRGGFAKSLQLANIFFRRVAKREGLKFGPITRDKDEERKMAKSHGEKLSRCRCYRAEVVG